VNSKQKIRIDHAIGSPLAAVLNVMARSVGAVWHRDHTISRKCRSIAVCKFEGMGNVIQATALLSALRGRFAETPIIFVTTRKLRGLLDTIPLVDQVLCLDDTSVASVAWSSLVLLAQLWRRRVDLFLNLEVYSFHAAMLTVTSCAVNRIGYYGLSYAFSRGIYTHMLFYNRKAPLGEIYLQMARSLGCATPSAGLLPFEVSTQKRDALRTKLTGLVGDAMDSGFVLVNPNASDLCIERRWPAESFARLVELIHGAFPAVTMLLTGSRGERGYVERLRQMVAAPAAGRVHSIAGSLDIGELIAAIAETRLLITNDTGPMHIAFALERLCLILWGPESPSHYGAMKNSVSIYKNFYCSPCVFDFYDQAALPCRGDNFCMKSIGVQEVFQAARQILERGTAGAPNPQPILYSDDRTGTPLGVVVR
jgi:ADP-heptose:LPS heptosyltransferase